MRLSYGLLAHSVLSGAVVGIALLATGACSAPGPQDTGSGTRHLIASADPVGLGHDLGFALAAQDQDALAVILEDADPSAARSARAMEHAGWTFQKATTTPDPAASEHHVPLVVANSDDTTHAVTITVTDGPERPTLTGVSGPAIGTPDQCSEPTIGDIVLASQDAVPLGRYTVTCADGRTTTLTSDGEQLTWD